jgi:hypothetical protein
VTAGGVVTGTLAADEAAETLRELATARARLEALLLAVLHHADVADVGSEVGATSTRAWLTHATKVPPRQANRLVRLARRLQSGTNRTGQPHDLVDTREALRAGAVDAERPQVVVEAVDRLPEHVDVADRRRAERHLLADAARLDAKALSTVAKHLLAVIDPDSADAELAKRVEAEEAGAARRTMLRIYDDGKGTCHGTFRVPTLHGAMLAKYLDALASPKRPAPIAREAVDEGRAVQRHSSEVLGEALCQLLERYPASRLPKTGGTNATVVVTMQLEKLLAGIGVATLDTGHHLSAGEVRRLACQTGVIPAVLGSRSEILDAGRKVRFHTPVQRIMLGVRDRSCTAVGCDRPAAWCHAHHDIPFSQGGRTDVKHGRLLCPRHHTLVHHPSYAVGDVGGGKILISKVCRRQQ